MVVPPDQHALLLIIRHPVAAPRPHAPPAVRPIHVFTKKHNCFEVVVMMGICHVNNQWVLRPTGTTKVILAPPTVAKAMWEEPHSVLGGMCTVTSSVQGPDHQGHNVEGLGPS